jgi:hypothetical protein
MIQFTKDFIFDNMAPLAGAAHNRFHLNIEGYSVSILGGGMAYGDGVHTFEVMITRGEENHTEEVFPVHFNKKHNIAGYVSVNEVVFGLNSFFAEETYA